MKVIVVMDLLQFSQYPFMKLLLWIYSNLVITHKHYK